MINIEQKYDFVKGEILLFDKEIRWSSFDLVQKIRNSICRELGIKKLKVGHAGTLDPLATGLMIICTGRLTKMIEELQKGEKEYIADLKIGATTPSFDLETEEDFTSKYDHVTETFFKKTITKFKGEIEQVPPIFSAVKINGVRSYELARKGQKYKLKSRKVKIESIDIMEFEPPKAKIRVVCGKGTYIRSLVRDIGKALNCGAYLTGLRRTKIGEYQVEDAFSINYFLNNLSSFATN